MSDVLSRERRSRPLAVLIIEDSEDDAALVLDILRRENFELNWRRVDTAAGMHEALASQAWDLILSDYLMPQFTALDALRIYNETGLDIPFIIVSGSIGEDIAVEAMRHGAHDYLLKDRLARLPVAVERELREAKSRKEKRASEVERARQAEELARAHEELVQQAEQLYRSNNDLERFAFVAAHDLQEPLRVINSYSQLLVRRFSPIDDKEVRDILGYIEHAVRSMRNMIDGLLAYSLVTSSETAHIAAIETQTVVRGVLVTMKQQLEETGASVEVGDLPAVNADPNQLTQIFQNLLSNAIKYRDQEKPPHVRIAGTEQGGSYLFSVADTGIGIHPDHHRQIFQLFRRLHREHYPGTGVGLAVCKRLVDGWGGDIWVESEPGKGSTFYFTIPKDRAAQAANLARSPRRVGMAAGDRADPLADARRSRAES